MEYCKYIERGAYLFEASNNAAAFNLLYHRGEKQGLWFRVSKSRWYGYVELTYRNRLIFHWCYRSLKGE